MLDLDTVGAQAPGSTTRLNTQPVPKYCAQGAAGLRVSEDSLGSLDLGMNLRSLRASCPAASDTVWPGENDVYPAVVFRFDGLNAIAVQYRDSLLPNEPAETWFISGANGVILGRLPLNASWGEVQRLFGAGIADGADGLIVMFCEHRRLLFELDASPDSVTPDRPADLSRIPSGARIKQLIVFHEINPTWHC